jgi:hypothetical protein
VEPTQTFSTAVLEPTTDAVEARPSSIASEVALNADRPDNGQRSTRKQLAMLNAYDATEPREALLYSADNQG